VVKTKLVKLDIKPCLLKEFISFWAQFYNESQYPDTTYKENLRKGKMLQENNITPLLKWKNGRPLSNAKKQIAVKITKNLEEFNRFRSLGEVANGEFAKFWKFVSSIVKTGLVWKVYLLHIARPDDYPIIDQHVLRAYHFLTYGEISEPEQSLSTYNSYKEFFFKVAKESGKEFREADKALMSLGQYLKTQFGQLLLKQEKCGYADKGTPRTRPVRGL